MLKFICAVILTSQVALANDIKNYIMSDEASSGVTFQIPYSLGVHEGTTSQMKSSVLLNQHNSVLSGKFIIPIDKMTTGNLTRDCHMREALGIDYTNSIFPNEHACDSNNTLPIDGPNAVVFPDIIFTFSSLSGDAANSLPETLVAGQTYTLLVQGQWQVHGHFVLFSDSSNTSEAQSIPVQVTLLDETSQELQIKTQLSLSLKAFNVEVKPFKIAFVKIGVGDIVKIKVNTKLSLKD